MKKEIPLEVINEVPSFSVTKRQEEKEKLQNRLKRIEGQVRGIQKMIDEDRYCVDVLVQLSAVNAALKKVGYTLLEQHTKGCVANAIKSGEEEQALDELMKVIHQFTK
ncbi:MAG: metal-sensing transcriptional repressor [Bacillaceae bacterium]|uniref:Metal-sensing transcriptional repressor n=1 Tax=Alkalihalobacterium chitinilyticum TaxID=2980103 RepID=A0ABT5VCG6_9BACI|nr:metal-sensing transcriptional repressor [Alkalihalobacterium chitinilyticum]MDE5412861.1 metal-sensing transcriptional repressor [Alkalihalobacterium chitinilyticum]MEB1809515.1 metal-sensing transcriptional repressor [Bacillaceae bacterium]